MKIQLELINSTTWSQYLSYLILTGIPLLIALPTTARIESLVEPRLSFLPIFITIATLLFTIYCLNFGPLHVQGNKPSRETQISLCTHVVFLLIVSLPYWTIFQGVSSLSMWRVVGALIYLFLYGLCWAWVGLVIGLRWPSEITQFKIKYALLIASIIATFFVLRPLNPFLTLSLWLGEGPLDGQWGFLITGYAGLAIAGGIQFVWASALLRRLEGGTP